MLNLTATMSIPSAEMELSLQPGELPMGYQVGGVSAFNSSFKRGYGNKMWGIDENGWWMGAANWADAPLRADYDGNLYFSKTDDDGNQLVIDAQNLRLVLYIAGVPQALWGFQSGGF